MQHALIAGDAVTGASVFQLVPELDAGDVFAEREYPVPSRRNGRRGAHRPGRRGRRAAERGRRRDRGGHRCRRHRRPASRRSPRSSATTTGASAGTSPRDAVLGRIRGVTPEPGAHTTLDGARVKMLAAQRGVRRTRRASSLACSLSTAARCSPAPPPTPIVARTRAARGQGRDERRGLVAGPPRRGDAGGRLMSAATRLATRRLRDDPGGARVRRVREPAAAARDRARRARHRRRRTGHRAHLRHAAAPGHVRRRHRDRRRPAASQEIDPAVLDALRLGVHQLLSTRVASHAAVNESVELARSAGGRGAPRLRQRGAAARLARHARASG